MRLLSRTMSTPTTARPPSIITSIEVFRVPPRWIFVKVQTSDGITGWGEGSLEGHTEAVEGAYLDLRQRFVGCNADNIQDIWQTAYRARFYRGGPVLMSALSGLDIALWDIKGKKLGVPVWQLLGGQVRDKVRVYGWIGGDGPTPVFGAAMMRVKQGFTAVKITATEAVSWFDKSNILEETANRLKDVKSLGVDVVIDCHGRLHKSMAKQLVKLLEPHQPMFIEEPIATAQCEEIADLSKTASTPLAFGARLFTRTDFRPFLEKRAIDIARPDVCHCGGISELHRIASLTEMYDVGLAPRSPLGPIAWLLASKSTLQPPTEMSLNIRYGGADQGVEADLHTYLLNPGIFSIIDGYIAAPTGPGLGIELNEQLIREASIKYVREYKAWRNPVWRGEDGTILEW